MRDLKDKLNESIISEGATAWKVNAPGTTNTKGFDMMSVGIRPNKEYGFMIYDEDVEQVHLIAADSAQDMADRLRIDLEASPDIEEMFKLKVNQTYTDFMNSGLVVRIW